MSRAFVKETGESAPPPERMVEDGPNPVTPEGLRQIEAHVARLEAAMKTEPNVLLRETWPATCAIGRCAMPMLKWCSLPPMEKWVSAQPSPSNARAVSRPSVSSAWTKLTRRRD
jgi:hypothetical protein